MEKWKIKKGSLQELTVVDSWSCDIIVEGEELEMIHVYARTEEQCLSRALKICKVNEMETALKTIRDAFWNEGETHKEQVVDLKSIAIQVLES